MSLPEQNQRTPLESLNEQLYSNRATQSAATVDTYREHDISGHGGWQAPPPPPPAPPKKRWSWSTWVAVAGVGFFVVSAAVAGYLFWQGNRAISSDRIGITFAPESAIASGDIVPIVVTIENNNPTDIFNASVFVDLPDGTRDGVDATMVRETYSDSLGDIARGDAVTRTIPVQLFGTQGQSLTIPVRVEYRVPDSNALLVANREFTISISSSPVVIAVGGPAQAASGEPLTLTVQVRSNASTNLADVALKAALPPGFLLTSSDPQVSSGGFVAIGPLAAGDSKQVRITGTLTGEAGEEKVFRFSAGTKNPDGTSTLAASFAEGVASVLLTKPTLAVNLSLDRQREEVVNAAPGQTIPALIAWENAGAAPLTDVRIEVKVAGAALDDSGTSGGTGFYRSSDRTIIFSKETSPTLAQIGAGDSGTGSFSLRTRSTGGLSGASQPTITVQVTATGVRDGQRVEVTPTFTRTVRVGTNVSITSSFTQSGGSVTPTPGQESIYQVLLTAKNTVNSVGAARITTQLPLHVRYGGSLSGASVTYDEASRTVTWNVGDLIPNATASASFTAVLAPSESQRGSSVVLAGQQSFVGTDRFSTAQVSASAPTLTVFVP